MSFDNSSPPATPPWLQSTGNDQPDYATETTPETVGYIATPTGVGTSGRLTQNADEETGGGSNDQLPHADSPTELDSLLDAPGGNTDQAAPGSRWVPTAVPDVADAEPVGQYATPLSAVPDAPAGLTPIPGHNQVIGEPVVSDPGTGPYPGGSPATPDYLNYPAGAAPAPVPGTGQYAPPTAAQGQHSGPPGYPADAAPQQFAPAPGAGYVPGPPQQAAPPTAPGQAVVNAPDTDFDRPQFAPASTNFVNPPTGSFPTPAPPTPPVDSGQFVPRIADFGQPPQQTQPFVPASAPTGFATPFAQPGTPGPTSLDEVALLRKARRSPQGGWRKAVHKLSNGHINPGDSPDEIHFQQLVDRVNQPVRGDYRIAVLSLKGGVGKTTTSIGLGSTFASMRGDRVIAVDANPDLGTLAQRVPQQTRSTVRDLLADSSIYRYSDVRAHTSQAPSRLEVLASERDPAVAEAFSEQDYRGVMKVLQRFYNIIITDCGTGLSHSAMNGVLDLANALILVSSPAIDGARSAGATLDWLQAHGYGHLVSNAVVVLSSSRPGSSTIDINQLGQHFLTRCRAVQTIPFDDHLAEGAEIDLELLNKHTQRALTEMAAVVADDFSSIAARKPEPFYR